MDVSRAYDGKNTLWEKIFTGLIVTSILVGMVISLEFRFVVVAVTLLMTIVMGHETGHALAAKAVGLKVEFMAIFIPMPFAFNLPLWSFEKRRIRRIPVAFDGTLWEFKIRGFPVVIGNAPIGGGVNIDDKQFEKAPWWQHVLVALAGPATNVLMAYLSLLVIANPVLAANYLWQIGKITLTGLVMVSSGKVPVSEVGGLVAVVNMTSQALQVEFLLALVLFSVVINLALAVTNLLPLIATDGGQVLVAVFSAMTRNRFRKQVRSLVKWSGNFLFGLTLLLIFKDLWDLL